MSISNNNSKIPNSLSLLRKSYSFYETRVEFLFDLAVLNPRSVARLRGIKLE
jgi:hypothetical protein